MNELTHDAARPACILLHGFGGTPFEMEPPAEALRRAGFSVALPLYPGHGLTMTDFRKTFFSDWLRYAEQQFLNLCEQHNRVVLTGFSMGGSIALFLAAKYAALPQLAGVAALAPAYTISRPYLLWRWLLEGLRDIRFTNRPPMPKQRAPKQHAHEGPSSRGIAPYQGYDRPFCLHQTLSFGKGLAAMRALLPALRCPLLLMAELNDKACPPDYHLKIARAVATDELSLRWVRMHETKTSHHMLTTHQETREQVAATVTEFATRVCAVQPFEHI